MLNHEIEAPFQSLLDPNQKRISADQLFQLMEQLK